MVKLQSTFQKSARITWNFAFKDYFFGMNMLPFKQTNSFRNHKILFNHSTNISAHLTLAKYYTKHFEYPNPTPPKKSLFSFLVEKNNKTTGNSKEVNRVKFYIKGILRRNVKQSMKNLEEKTTMWGKSELSTFVKNIPLKRFEKGVT